MDTSDRYLVTGGAGFIGSWLTETLLDLGAEVYVLDDLSTGNLENIQHLMDNPNMHFVLGSVFDVKTVNRLMEKCHAVFHLAAAVGVRLIFERPIFTLTTNVRGTEIVLESALRYGRKVLIASTSEVYGKDTPDPSQGFKETDDITLGVSQRWCYAAAKALDEHLAMAYYRENGLPIIVCRFFNTVGPRQTGAYGMVIPRFVEAALGGRPIQVYGDGYQTRSFTWVGDAVDATIELMVSDRAIGEIFNIGSDEPITIRDLAMKVKELTGSDSEVTLVPYEEAYGKGFEDIRCRVPDTTKIRRCIGYRPTHDLKQILGEVIEYTAERMNLKVAV
jgi:UDP-glucose 4-epimerase